MKIRRRGHPTQPSTGHHAPNSHTPRMTRASHDLYNHNGDPIDREEIQAAVEEATARNAASGGRVRTHGKAV